MERNEQLLCFREEVIFEPGFRNKKEDFRQKIAEKLLRAKGTASKGTKRMVRKGIAIQWGH